MYLGEKTIIKSFKIQGVYEVGGGGVFEQYINRGEINRLTEVFSMFFLYRYQLVTMMQKHIFGYA